MDRTEHGRERAGKIGASMAQIIDRGGRQAWETLAKNLWADETGADFAADVGGARAYGHEHEAEGVAKFWERHPELEVIEDVGWLPYTGSDLRLRPWLGCSPDRRLRTAAGVIGGLEVKSPVLVTAMEHHLPKHHRPQCGHSMLVTGAPWWWLVVHHGEAYQEIRLPHDPQWERQYVAKLYAFLGLLNEGKQGRRRMRVADLDNL
jgi:hypothetical protein